MQTKIAIGIGLGIVLVGGVVSALAVSSYMQQKETEQNPQPILTAVSTFEECMTAGYPVMESYPRQCKTPEGDTYTETITKVQEPAPTKPTPPKESPVGECYVGGCSSQICSGTPGAISTCMYREEYACYQKATCERQATGVCGWTETPELTSCLTNAQ